MRENPIYISDGQIKLRVDLIGKIIKYHESYALDFRVIQFKFDKLQEGGIFVYFPSQ